MKNMKNKEIRKAVCEAFEAPTPIKKQTFLKTVPKAQISHTEFMLLQICYIRKWIWIVSAIIFGVALDGAYFVERDMLWVISSLVPFAALSIATENARSAAYGMEELEMSSRFSLKSIVLARLGILGIFHIILLCLLIALGAKNSAYPLFRTGIYLTVPYLITTVFSMTATRKYHGKEGFYACMGIAALVSALNIFMNGGGGNLYKEDYFRWWVAAFAVLAVSLAAECKRTIHQTEELVWNLQ